jgi:hypothetical protein
MEESIMRVAARRVVFRVLAGCAAIGLSQGTLAQLHITGRVPVGAPGSNGGIVVVLPSTQTGGNTNYTVSGLLKFKFRAPTAASVTHVPYNLGFCVGPPANPCGLATSIVVSVAGGGPGTFALIDASAFANGNVLAVVNPTSTPVQFDIELE